MWHRGNLLMFLALLVACQDNSKVLDQETYEGPSVTMYNIDVLISDSTLIKMRLIAPKQLEFEDKDRDFPEGIFLQFFNPLGQVTSALKADRGHYYSKEDYYKAEGNVIMQSTVTMNTLSTEELNWVPKEERIHTDKFVTITTINEVLTGEGLEAEQDFEEYTILKPSGTMLVDPMTGEPVEREDDDFDESLIFEEDTTAIF